MTLLTGLMLLPGLAIGLTFHEFAHAWSASLLGDDWPRRQGRVSLNPFRHLSLLGTLAIFLLPIGWAKPVQVNAFNFRKPKRDYLLVSLAGPAANLLVVVACFGLAQLASHTLWFDAPVGQGLMALAYHAAVLTALINAILATVNLLPIPPLDGSKIWQFLSPNMKVSSTGKHSLVFLVLIMVLLWSNAIDPVFRFASTTVIGIMPRLDTDVRADQQYAAAEASLASGDAPAAVRLCDQSLEYEPDRPHVLALRAKAKLALGDFPGARADIEQAITLDPMNPDALEILFNLPGGAGKPAAPAGE